MSPSFLLSTAGARLPTLAADADLCGGTPRDRGRWSHILGLVRKDDLAILGWIVMLGNQVPAVQPDGVAERLADGWMLLDVRTEDEWAEGRIAGSVHIPMDQLLQRLDEVGDRVVCVCAVGARSARVTQFLNSQGREAVNLDGGLHAWAVSGYSIEG